MFCPECGYKNNNENKFCRECGTRLPQQSTTFSENNVPQTITPIYSESLSDSVTIKGNPEKRKKIILCGSIIGAVILIAIVFLFIIGVMSGGAKSNGFQGRIASGSMYTIVLNDDGTVNSYLMEELMKNASKRTLMAAIGFGQCDVSEWKDITAVSTSRFCTVGLKKDGGIVATGDGWMAEEVSQWKDIAAISVSDQCAAGIKRNGTVVTTNEELDISGWENIVDISIGDNCIAGIKKDGTVVYAVEGADGTQKMYLNNLNNTLSDWKDIVDIEITDGVLKTFPNIIAVRKNGTVATAIFNDKEYDWVSSDNYSNWKDIIDLSSYIGTGYYNAGLKKDGTVVTNNENMDVSDWKDIVAISAGKNYIAGLKEDGTLVSTATLIEYDKSAVDEIINSESDDKSENTADNEILPDTEADVTVAATEAETKEPVDDFDSIIPGIHTGMTEDEMLNIMGYGFNSLITPEDGEFYDSRTDYEYILDSIPILNCNMPAVMFFEFNEQGKLFNFGYHIGFDSLTYYYGETELVNEYDRIYNLIESSGISWTNIIDDYEDTGIIRAYSGSLNSGNEELWFVVGTDMWNNSGMNQITMSCSDETLFPLY